MHSNISHILTSLRYVSHYIYHYMCVSWLSVLGGGGMTVECQLFKRAAKSKATVWADIFTFVSVKPVGIFITTFSSCVCGSGTRWAKTKNDLFLFPHTWFMYPYQTKQSIVTILNSRSVLPGNYTGWMYVADRLCNSFALCSVVHQHPTGCVLRRARCSKSRLLELRDRGDPAQMTESHVTTVIPMCYEYNHRPTDKRLVFPTQGLEEMPGFVSLLRFWCFNMKINGMLFCWFCVWLPFCWVLNSDEFIRHTPTYSRNRSLAHPLQKGLDCQSCNGPNTDLVEFRGLSQDQILSISVSQHLSCILLGQWSNMETECSLRNCSLKTKSIVGLPLVLVLTWSRPALVMALNWSQPLKV